jgi:hypothetical protein
MAGRTGNLRDRVDSAPVRRLLLAIGLLALACGGDGAGPGGSPDGSGESFGRGAGLGPDGTRIEDVRVTLETGTLNGAGTDNNIALWFDNQRMRLTSTPGSAFAAGGTLTTTLAGEHVPRNLGELRRASIVLTMDLARASIASSWFCEDAKIEVRLEGDEDFRTYLDDGEVGWLSQDEPPRRSTAYALQ